MALTAAWHNPKLLQWIWELAGPRDMMRWVLSYLNYTRSTIVCRLLQWLPLFLRVTQPLLVKISPPLWFGLLARSYAITYGMGRPMSPEPIPANPDRQERPLSTRTQKFAPSTPTKSSSPEVEP
jgi:lycopene cyclase CruA